LTVQAKLTAVQRVAFVLGAGSEHPNASIITIVNTDWRNSMANTFNHFSVRNPNAIFDTDRTVFIIDAEWLAKQPIEV
jgi:hypothetical protein